MLKSEFLSQLRAALSDIPDHDVEERIAFYSEMIDDLIDEGMSEEEAVERVGPVDRIVSETLGTIPLFELVKRKIKKKTGIPAWGIALLIIFSPILFTLAVSVLAMAVSLFATMWCTVLTLWAVLLSFSVGAIAGALGGLALILFGSWHVGLAAFGAGVTLAGLTIFMFYVCKMATKGVAALTKMSVIGIKKMFI